MSDDIIKDIKDIFEIKEDISYEFKEVNGLTFVFKTKIMTIKNRMPSAEIKPIGIIYKKDNDYYFAPLDRVDNLSEIVKEYVKTL